MRKQSVLQSSFISFAFISLISCSSGDSSGSMSIEGAAQKGPFITGTPVFVNKLDALGNTTDSTMVTEIVDSIGSFSFNMESLSPVQIIANGYYFSELTGQVSSGTLTLKSLYNTSTAGTQKAYINVMTHLINDRALHLMNSGQIGIDAAITQAQQELVTALNPVIPVADLPDFSSLSIYNMDTNNTQGNAYLLALSTALYQLAENKAAGLNTSSDAQLALLLNTLSDDLASDGSIETADFIDDLTTALRMLDPNGIQQILNQRSSLDYAIAPDVPDITQFFGLCSGAANCPWAARAPVPLGIRYHASAIIGDKIYVFGGVTEAEDYTDWTQIQPSSYTSLFEYDISTNKWSRKQPLPVSMTGLAAHTIGNKIYVLRNYTTDDLVTSNNTYEYDPTLDQWTEKLALPTPRAAYASEVLDGKIYVIGGSGSSGSPPTHSFYDDVEIYDPGNNSWSTGTSMPVPTNRSASCTLGSNIYIFGGYSHNFGGVRTNTYKYDTVADQWTEVSPSTTPRMDHQCATVDNTMYIMGGMYHVPDPEYDSMDKYVPAQDSWTPLNRMPQRRRYFASEVHNNLIYLIGGTSTEVEYIKSVDVFDTSL